MKDEVFCERTINPFTPLHSLYQFLWTTEESQEIPTSLDFQLPHTVLIKEQNLGPWFFSDKKKMLRKKKADKITTENILEQFGKRDKKFPKKVGWKKDVVALYIYSDTSHTDDNSSGKNYYTDYFDYDMLKDFLVNRRFRSAYGVLQKFVVPMVESECVIESHWTKNVCVVEIRQNRYKVQDRYVLNLDKCITFDGPQHCSVNKILSGNILNRVKRCCDYIAKHINLVSFGNREIKCMKSYWKLDRSDGLNLLYCGYLDLIKLYRGVTVKPNHESDIVGRFGHREDIDFIFDPSKKRTLLKFKNAKCLHCKETKIPEKFITVKNEFLMKYYNKREGVQTVEKKEEIKLNSFQQARQRKKLFEGAETLVDEFFTQNCQLPLYYRRKYDINQYNKDGKEKLNNNLKFTKFDTS